KPQAAFLEGMPMSRALLVALLLAAPVAAQEPLAPSRIVSVDLFKNGLAIVKRQVQVKGPGTFRLDVVPEAIHGTFWIQSASAVEASIKKREVEVPADQTEDGALQDIFHGKFVTIHFGNDKRDPISGTV